MKTVFHEPPSLFSDFRKLLEKSPDIVAFPVNNVIRFFFLMPFLLSLMIFLQPKFLSFFMQKKRKHESQPPVVPCWGDTAEDFQSPTFSSCTLTFSTGRANGSSSSMLLLGQVGSFSNVSLSHAAGSIPLSLAVPSGDWMAAPR